MNGTLVVFAKWPAPGAVKTRLCPPLTLAQAAELYAAMLDDVLAAMALHAPPLGLACVLAGHPHEALAQFAARAPGWRVVAQEGADLSARKEHVAASELAPGAHRGLVGGSATPARGPGLVAAGRAARTAAAPRRA
ncbi:MAG: hypothetical protein ACHQ6V_13975 [Myxococcota bacterium]